MSADNLMTALARSTSAVAFRIASSAVIGFVGALVIARIIGAPLYGSYLAAQALTLTVSAIAQWGIGMALVRTKEDPDTQRLSTAWWLLLIIGLVGAFSGTIIGYLVFPSDEFQETRLAILLMLPAMAVTLPASVPLALLERKMQFARIASVELLGSLAWLGAGLGIGLAGAGIWALPLAWISQQVIHAIAWYAFTGYRPQGGISIKSASSLLGFGSAYSSTTVSWQLRPLVAPMTIGIALGTAAIGQIGMAARIMEALSLVRNALWRAAAPIFGRLQSNDDAAGQILRSAGAVTCAATASLSVIFVIAIPLVRRLIGSEWDEALALFPFFAVHGMIASLLGLISLTLHVKGRSLIVTGFNLIHIAILALAAIILTPQYGLIGWGYAELFACASFPLLIVACPREIRRHLRPLIILGLGIPAIAWFLFSPSITSALIGFSTITVMALFSVRWVRQTKAHFR